MRAKIDPEAAFAVMKALADAGFLIIYFERNVGSNEYNIEIASPFDEEQARQVIKQALIDFQFKNVDQWDTLKLRHLSKEEVENWIDSNVMDLASAKAVLKRLAALLIYLYKREMDNI